MNSHKWNSSAGVLLLLAEQCIYIQQMYFFQLPCFQFILVFHIYSKKNVFSLKPTDRWYTTMNHNTIHLLTSNWKDCGASESFWFLMFLIFFIRSCMKLCVYIHQFWVILRLSFIRWGVSTVSAGCLFGTD